MDYTIKELPEDARPREKLEKKGLSGLSNVELLSIVLRTGIKGKNVKELSAEILDSYSMAGLAERDMEELQGFEGVSRVKAGQLKAVGEIARRLQREERDEIRNLSDVRARVEDMKFLEEERLRMFCLSSGNEILSEEEFEGGISSVKIDVKDLLREAIKKNSSAVVLAHNHPSGRAEPTPEDKRFTEKIVGASEKVGLQVLDHVIVGRDISSMRASGEAEFASQDPI